VGSSRFPIHAFATTEYHFGWEDIKQPPGKYLLFECPSSCAPEALLVKSIETERNREKAEDDPFYPYNYIDRRLRLSRRSA
jgi:hypothetical protein